MARSGIPIVVHGSDSESGDSGIEITEVRHPTGSKRNRQPAQPSQRRRVDGQAQSVGRANNASDIAISSSRAAPSQRMSDSTPSSRISGIRARVPSSQTPQSKTTTDNPDFGNHMDEVHSATKSSGRMPAAAPGQSTEVIDITSDDSEQDEESTQAHQAQQAQQSQFIDIPSDSDEGEDEPSRIISASSRLESGPSTRDPSPLLPISEYFSRIQSQTVLTRSTLPGRSRSPSASPTPQEQLSTSPNFPPRQPLRTSSSPPSPSPSSPVSSHISPSLERLASLDPGQALRPTSSPEPVAQATQALNDLELSLLPDPTIWSSVTPHTPQQMAPQTMAPSSSQSPSVLRYHDTTASVPRSQSPVAPALGTQKTSLAPLTSPLDLMTPNRSRSPEAPRIPASHKGKWRASDPEPKWPASVPANHVPSEFSDFQSSVQLNHVDAMDRLSLNPAAATAATKHGNDLQSPVLNPLSSPSIAKSPSQEGDIPSSPPSSPSRLVSNSRAVPSRSPRALDRYRSPSSPNSLSRTIPRTPTMRPSPFRRFRLTPDTSANTPPLQAQLQVAGNKTLAQGSSSPAPLTLPQPAQPSSLETSDSDMSFSEEGAPVSRGSRFATSRAASIPKNSSTATLPFIDEEPDGDQSSPEPISTSPVKVHEASLKEPKEFSNGPPFVLGETQPRPDLVQNKSAFSGDQAMDSDEVMTVISSSSRDQAEAAQFFADTLKTFRDGLRSRGSPSSVSSRRMSIGASSRVATSPTSSHSRSLSRSQSHSRSYSQSRSPSRSPLSSDHDMAPTTDSEDDELRLTRPTFRRLRLPSVDRELLESPPPSSRDTPASMSRPNFQIPNRRRLPRVRKTTTRPPLRPQFASLDARAVGKLPRSSSPMPPAGDSNLLPKEDESSGELRAITKAASEPPVEHKAEPTYRDLQEAFLQLLRYCQRFIPMFNVDYYRSPSEFRKGSHWAQQYTGMIQRSSPNELGCPTITVENHFDPEEQPCPPFEFLWTNDVILGHGVPPTTKLDDGCDCDGPCSPDPKVCACARRQQEFTKQCGYEKMKGGPFVYTKDGRLKRDEEIIIMECHGGCTCSEQCRNRVIQQGRKMKLKLKKTKKKGWGLFTKEAIPALTFIGVYGGEMITTTESDTRGDLYDTCFKGRTYQYGLDFHYQKTAANEPSFVVDAFWVGNYTRFLNHSCDPNCATFPAYIEETDLRKPFLVMFTTKDVKHGEELTFNYSGSSYDDDGNPKVCRENNICIYSMANWMYDSGGIRIKGADESVQVPLRFRKLS